MSFIWPPMLLLLSVIPLGVALYLVRESGRERRVAAYGVAAAAADGASQPFRRRIPALLILAGLTILILSLARPQSVVSVPRIEGTIILAFDVSGSMSAADIEPTRMEASKTAAREFVERQPASVLIGLVAFSDSGFNIQVPTNDQTLILAAINRLAPERGTAIGRGIMTSLTTIASADDDPAAGYYTNRSPGPSPDPTAEPGTYSSAAIILLSDGENNQRPDPLEAARAAADAGVRIYTVGLGSADGTTIEVEGFKVHSRLDEAMLRAIAETTDGVYYAAADPEELSAIYDSIQTRLVVRPEEMEVTSLFAGAGILILVVGGVASLFWLGRLP